MSQVQLISEKTVTFRLPTDLLEAIDAEAARCRVFRSDLLRQVLEDYLAKSAEQGANKSP